MDFKEDTQAFIDLRSDTVTKPTAEMKKAMFEADVGDDVFGEDPTINKLQQIAAQMFGKEDALFVPSGTMGNLISILCHCKPGEEIIVGDQSHIYLNEQGGCASIGGVVPRVVTNLPDGSLPLQTLKERIRGDNDHHAYTRLVALENTHNYCGGAVLSTNYVESVADFVHSSGNSMKLHVDGARIFNASVVLNEPVDRMTRTVDTLSVCLSKGLGSPAGSLVVGNSEFVKKARRWRKALGGGMRQAGVLAAAGIVSLTTMVDRLAEDHQNAKYLANSIKDIPGLTVFPAETNIVMVTINDDVYEEGKFSAPVATNMLKHRGILVTSFGPKRVRLVTHHHITEKDVVKAAQHFHEVFEILGAKA